MIIISKAILHIMDLNSGITIFSTAELDMGAPATYEFLAGHIDKLQKDAAAKTGEFLPESSFSQAASDYLDEKMTITDFSAAISKKLETAFVAAGETEAMDIVFCDFTVDTERYLGLILYDSRPAFTHQVVNDGEVVRNEIIGHRAILPNPLQKVATFALINVASGEIRFCDKKRNVNGAEVYVLPEQILQCSATISTRDTVKTVTKLACKVAEDYGYNSTEAVAKVKNYLSTTIENNTKLKTNDLAQEVFANSEVLQKEFREGMAEAKIPEQLAVEKNYVERASKSLKLRTDTGIEITVPAEYLDSSEYIEFVNNADGTIAISIKNIGKILQR